MDKTRWTVDPAHSSVGFNICFSKASKIKGTFHSYEAVMEADPGSLVTANIAFTVDLASVDTQSKERDARLLSEDFFDVEKFPEMRFIANNILQQDDGQYELVGEFSLHGVTRTESIFLTFKEEVKDPDGSEKAGFHAEGKIKRSDYGLTLGAPTGDDVNIELDVRLIKEA
ncbi:YceI family protein [Domibacillus indicus]|uniref:YceI family protein n=1 Tax=Domibacillus indicus TaxID=1437523 RepID=UPI000617C9B9|nr:YceI family protein [Domibacillus indicus]